VVVQYFRSTTNNYWIINKNVSERNAGLLVVKGALLLDEKVRETQQESEKFDKNWLLQVIVRDFGEKLATRVPDRQLLRFGFNVQNYSSCILAVELRKSVKSLPPVAEN
jgi:hypothetical protein